ncbi:MAG TPA: cytochrome c biogenesis protein CcsA [Acidobacteriaceae bacterium]
MQRSRIVGPIGIAWFILTLAVIVHATRMGLLLAPTDALQGNVFRIIFYHVPHSMLSMVFPYVNLVASLFYLYWRRRDPLKALTADAVAIASAEVTVVYGSICLLTGMLWGRVAWGIWWTWDARLTSMLLLWLLYVSYLMLRKLSSTGQTHTLAAVLSVFAAIDVPIVYMSIQWWRTQHPSPIFFSGDPDAKMDPSMLPAFLWNVVAWAMWGIFLLGVRFALERRRQQSEQDAALQAIEASLELAK